MSVLISDIDMAKLRQIIQTKITPNLNFPPLKRKKTYDNVDDAKKIFSPTK